MNKEDIMKVERLEIPKANKQNEHLISVSFKVDGGFWIIYDLTSFFPSYKGIERKNYMARVIHSIVGKEMTVHIIGDIEDMDYDTAKRIAIEYIQGRSVIYRLD